MNKFFGTAFFTLLLGVSLVLVGCKSNKERELTGQTDEGRLSGLFSISESKQVRFSRGNLQYCPHDHIMRFAEKQYSMVSDSVNSEVSRTFRDYVDMFCWGTGENAAAFGAVGSMYKSFKDWGRQPIINGGNKPNMWRTLSDSEWAYLVSYRPNASDLMAVGCVLLANGESVNGLVLLPDNWQKPQGVDLKIGCEDTTGLGMSIDDLIQESSADMELYFDSRYGMRQTWDENAWRILEQSGAVFLPAGGIRESVPILGLIMLQGADSYGRYWSSTNIELLLDEGNNEGETDKNFARSLLISPYGAEMAESDRGTGMYVRLVQDVY